MINLNDNESRPKVHRLPDAAEPEGELYVSRTVVIVCLALLLAAVVPALISFMGLGEKKAVQSIPPAQAKLLAPQQDVTVVYDSQGQTIGQLAKMPADMQLSGSIQSISKADQQAAAELMHIISKE